MEFIKMAARIYAQRSDQFRACAILPGTYFLISYDTDVVLVNVSDIVRIERFNEIRLRRGASLLKLKKHEYLAMNWYPVRTKLP